MNPNKIFSVMNLARAARENGDILNPLFISPPGLGKTEITQQWAKQNNLQCIVLNLASYDPPDFKGFPNIQVVNKRQRMSFATPDIWPDEGQGVIVLEELNRANTSIMQCILSLTDGRRGFDGYKLPDGWIVVGCINPENEHHDVNYMDAALKDRFEMYHVTYDKNTFVNYMKTTNWNKNLINFVEANLWMYKTPEEVGNVPGSKYIAPRTLSKLNAILNTEPSREDEMDFYTSALGSNVAKDFYNFLYNESPVMMHDITVNLKGSLSKLEKFADPNNCKTGMISLTIRDIIESNTITDDVLVQVIKVLPVDQSTQLIRDLEFKRKDESLLINICKKYPEIKKQFKDVLKSSK